MLFSFGALQNAQNISYIFAWSAQICMGPWGNMFYETYVNDYLVGIPFRN